MSNKKNIIIGSIVIFIFIIGSISFVALNKYNPIGNEKSNEEVSYDDIAQGTLDFFNSISGVKGESIEIINIPFIGIKGEIFAPEDSIVNGINYFLKSTNNTKMQNIKIDIQNNSIELYTNYAVTNSINTPIKVNIVPSLNEDNDLVIDIQEVKLLDLKLADFFVNLALKTFVKDWFFDSNIKVEYDNNNVIIYHDNFIGININALSLENDGISLDLIIDAEKFIR